MRYTRNNRPAAPRLVPTGNVDDVVLTGKSHGKNLTLFQSIGLAVLGLCVVLGIGVSAIAGEFILQAKFERTGLPYTKELGFGILMCLLGGMWIAMGLFGVFKVVRKKK